MERLTSLKRILRRPRDANGWALTFDTGWGVEAVPECHWKGVGRVSPHAVDICVDERRCGVCGDKVGDVVYFIVERGEPEVVVGGTAPMHRDCARASMAICPAIANPNSGLSNRFHDPVLARCSDYDPTDAGITEYELEFVELPKLKKPGGCPVTATKRFLGLDAS